MLIVRNINAHSPIWNPHCYIKKNSGPLEELIDCYKLIVNNNPDYITYLSSQSMVSIIDLAQSSLELGPLYIQEIPEEYPLLSDHGLILLGWEDMS